MARKTDLPADESLEALKDWWQKNGRYLIIGGIAGLAAIGGWKGWEYHTEVSAREAAGIYQNLFDSVLIGVSAQAEAEQYFAEIREHFPNTPYPSMAGLAMARLNVEQGQLKAAADNLRWVAENTGQTPIRPLALIRLARVLIEMGEVEEATMMMVDPDFPEGMDALAAEVYGDALARSGNKKEAIAEYRDALSKLPDETGFLQMKLQDLGASPENKELN